MLTTAQGWGRGGGGGGRRGQGGEGRREGKGEEGGNEGEGEEGRRGGRKVKVEVEEEEEAAAVRSAPCWPSPECFPADTPGRSFQSSADLPGPVPPAALASGGRCGSSAGPSAAAAWLAGGWGRGGDKRLDTAPRTTSFPRWFPFPS